MSIFPLPVYEADADPHNREGRTDEEIYASLEVPSTLVVKFGAMKLVAELPYSGDVKPGCGTKLVARTHRGTEIVEMLTTTCENAGCSKSITRKEMLEYIENSGGKDFPFHTEGQVMRVASIEDLNRMAALEGRKREWLRQIKQAVIDHRLDMKVVEVEPILGEEVLTIYFMAEDRVDFRELVRQLASLFKTRIEMRQVGARDEARLVADYERCGQHCCCKNFLKVLKPVSMRAAKMQKATLDPLKISGRCGRLMCCLRYEDQSYRELKKNLPNRKARVGTPYGPGIVLDSKILAQLVLVKLDHKDEPVAVPVEELTDPEACPQPAQMSPAELERFEARIAAGDMEDPLRGMEIDESERRDQSRDRGAARSKPQRQDDYRRRAQRAEAHEHRPDEPAGKAPEPEMGAPSTESKPQRGKRRRGKRHRSGEGQTGSAPQPGDGANRPPAAPTAPESGDAGQRSEPSAEPGGPRRSRKRRRGGRRRRRGGGGSGPGQGGEGT